MFNSSFEMQEFARAVAAEVVRQMKGAPCPFTEADVSALRNAWLSSEHAEDAIALASIADRMAGML